VLDVGLSEFFIIGAVALLVVGPKELPMLMARIGRWTGKARAMARHARAGFDTMVREAEIEEMNKRWEAENARIMAATQGQSFAEPLTTDIDPPSAAPNATSAPRAMDTAADEEPVTVLPGLDGDASDPHRSAHRQAGVAAPPPGLPETDPTDWQDPPSATPPLMRPLATAPDLFDAAPAPATAAPEGAPRSVAAAPPAAAGHESPTPMPRRPRKARTARAPDPPAKAPPAS
jgi:sec-independent protein translocase protein TatB